MKTQENTGTGYMRVTVMLLLSLFTISRSYLGQWHSYTNKDHIFSMQVYNGHLFVGTSGGIRNIDPVSLEEKEYGNQEGLLEANIIAMAVSSTNQLWAASQGGFLYAFDGNRWQTYGRSYVAERWRPNLRAMVAKGKYIAIGTEKGLTFFDTDQKLAKVNLTKFGNLINASVLSVILKGDTLYFGTEKGVLKTAVDWNNILSNKYRSIFDPNIWMPVEFPPQKPSMDRNIDSIAKTATDTVARPFDHLVWHDDALESYSRGQVRYGAIDVEAILEKPLKIGGKIYPYLKVFDLSEQIGDRIFLGGPNHFLLLSDAKTSDPKSANFFWMRKSNVPPDRIFNVVSRGAKTVALSLSGLFKIENEKWDAIPGYSFYSPEILERNLRSLILDSDGGVYLGTWGLGILHLKDGRSSQWNSGNSHCLDTVLSNYTVVNAISDVHEGGLWATIFKKDNFNSYDLVYLDINRNEVLCQNLGGSGKVTHRVKVFSKNVVAVAGEGGIDLYTYDKVGGFHAKAWKSIRSGSTTESWDAEMDSFGRVWGLMLGRLVYIPAESLQTSKYNIEPITFDDFTGQDCHQMESDLSGSLWIGCSNGLYRVSPSQSLNNIFVQRYSLDDGLLSNTITDISVNKDDGQVWLATENGINMYESEYRHIVTGFSSLKVYPNPFRARHQYVLFDNLPSGVDVRIHTESGIVVKNFPSSMIKGGQCQWDGRNTQGIKVTPGIYLYSVTGSGKNTQGKIIVAR